MEKKLQVKDLRISFRTSNGKVQAVRDISFDLAKGETLAIVGESGSGKSVTSKAILGIQAANSITESGEILYDGQDLLKISEEDFHKLRGDKIAMIFQDPMSSLNPIVRIGKQLTEAMILKGKARQRESRNNFNTYLANLKKAMTEACAEGDSAKAAQIAKACKNFDKFEFKHTELESAYNRARENAEDAFSKIEPLAFELEKNAAKEASYRIGDISRLCQASLNPYVVPGSKEFVAKAKALEKVFKNEAKSVKAKAKKGEIATYTQTPAALRELGAVLEKALETKQPNFFRLGYYVTFSNQSVPDVSVEELDERNLKYLMDNFMTQFLADGEKAIAYTAGKTYDNMTAAIELLNEKKAVFAEEKLNKSDCKKAVKELKKAIEACIDPLTISRDSLTYTFGPALEHEVNTYFDAIGKNAKAQKAHDKEQRKYDAQVAKGKEPDWEVAAAAITDLELVKENIAHLIERQVNHYNEKLAARDERNYSAETVAAIDYLKDNASGVVAKVTKRLAKRRAIKLMDEVGIPEPHKRYRQYPFEFSGGMRQRIVIAIALAANPDILICDEPTTALDVTIQSQILELINKLKAERQLSVIFITHDLGVVANMADRVAVMYAGKIVEHGTAEDIFYDPRHPYTWALLSSMPDLDTNEKLDAIPGTPPNMIYPPVGDAFAARNKYAMQIDFEKQPPMFQVSDTHYAATWLLHPNAPKVDLPKTIAERIERMKSKREESNEQ